MNARLEPLFVNVKEAAAFLGLEPFRIYELLNSGEVAGRYDGRKRLVSVRSLREFAENLPTERPEAS